MSDTMTQDVGPYDPRETILSGVIPPFVWALATLSNATVVAFLSPFIGPNLLVTIAGGYEDLPGWSLDLSAVVGPFACGAIIGFVTWRLARPGLTPTAAVSPRTTILTFSFSALLAAGGLFMLQAIFLTLHPVACASAPILWIASIALPTYVGFRSIRLLRNIFATPSPIEPHA